MKKIVKVVFVVLVLMLLVSNLSTISYAATVDKITAGDILNKADGFLDVGKENKIQDGSIKTLSSTIYNILLVVGIIAAIMVGMFMGIKYMMGTIDEKAEVKGMFIVYIIGCIVVFGAFGIWSALVNVLQ